MIDTQSIRSNLLEAAIHGELTDNRDDASLDSILSEINNQYRSLLSQKNTKEIVDSPMISEDLFELPDTWAWVPLRQLCIFLSRGKSPKYSETAKYPVFAQKCNQPAGLALERALFLDETTLDKWQEFFRLQDGDILINSTGTGTMGRVGYYESVKLNPEYPFMVPDSHVTVARVGDGLVSKYAYYALRSPSLQKIMEKQFRGTTNQKEFYINSAAAMPIPLPPPTVQERIVEVLDSSLEFLQIIDQLQTQYADNLTLLKRKLIDAAIQGKLTEQISEDGTAEELYQQIQEEKQALIRAGKIKKEKPLPEIKMNEIPYEIPKSWKWVRIGEVVSFNPRHMVLDDDLSVSFIPMPRVLEGYNNLHSSEERKWKDVKTGYTNFCEGDVGVAKITPCFQNRKSVVFRNLLNGVGAGTTEFTVMRPIGALVESEYLLWFCKSDDFIRKGVESFNGSVGQARVDKDYMRLCLLPLPPLAEQKRIVARLDQALAMIEV